MQSNAKQGNFVPIDSCLSMSLLCPKEKLFTLVEAEENKFIEEQVPKFDDGKLVDRKDVLVKINV